MGIGDRDQAGGRQGHIDSFLIFLQRRDPLQFKRLQAGADHEDRCIAVLDFPIVNNEARRAKVGIGLDDRSAFLSPDVVCGPLIGFYPQAMLIGECMGCSNGIHIIAESIAFGPKVTVADPSPGFEIRDILWGCNHTRQREEQ